MNSPKNLIDAVVCAMLVASPECDSAEIARRVESEGAAAAEVVREILLRDDSAIRASPSMMVRDVPRRLLDAIDGARYSWKPQRMLAVARLAHTITANLRESPVIAFVSLKEQATALRMLLRFDEAHRCLDAAAIVAHRTARPAVNRAITEYARAGVLCDEERPQDALRSLRAAQSALRDGGDLRRLEDSRTLEAKIYHDLGRYAEALELYEEAFARALDRNEESRAAMESANIGHCLIALGEPSGARGYLSLAEELSASQGMDAHRGIALRALGRLTIRETGSDEHDELRTAAGIFDRLRMVGQWCLTRLALAEELLAYSPDTDITPICREVCERSVSARIGVVAATATQMLTFAAKRGEATPSLVREVSQYIDHSAMDASIQ